MKTERDPVTGKGTFDLVHQKNGPSGLHLEFEYQEHAFSDEDGKTCTTLIPRRIYDAPTTAPVKVEPKPGHGGVQKIMLAEMVTLARRHVEGVDDADLKSAFVASYHEQRIGDGKEGLSAQSYTSKFINTLKVLLGRGNIVRNSADDGDQASGKLFLP